MKVELEIRDDKAESVLQTLENIKYIKKVRRIKSEKQRILDGLAEAVEEVKLHKQGKIKLKTARELLNKL